MLRESGIVRSDIRSSFGSASGVADGVPTTVTLVISDSASNCAPLAGAAVYLWHCDIDGRYSMYSQGVTDQNYLRGVQETADDGSVTFTTIFPAVSTTASSWSSRSRSDRLGCDPDRSGNRPRDDRFRGA